MSKKWITETVSHNEQVSVLDGAGQVRIYFKVNSGSATLQVLTSSDGFVNDSVELVAAATDDSVTSINTNQGSLTLLGSKIKFVVSDPTAGVTIKVNRQG